ncbi:MAG: FtsW/RodA/SpoVE family cell cycle protein [Porphyromonas sp.]|nr:FtsW/RodA/SpoVE family cell cycle protein [Porphyromonas sp.]
MGRSRERSLLLTSTGLLVLMAWLYWGNIRPSLEEVSGRYSTGEAINLERGLDVERLRSVLGRNDYFGDVAYERYVAMRLGKILEEGPLPNLGALNKRSLGQGDKRRDIYVSAEELAREGGKTGRQRYEASCIILGRDSSTMAKLAGQELESKVAVTNEDTGLELWGRIVDSKGEPMAGRVVRLTEELSERQRDSLQAAAYARYAGDMDSFMEVKLDTLVQTPTYYARTDAEGRYRFTGLGRGKSYALLPLHIGREYGPMRGIAYIDDPSEGVFKSFYRWVLGRPHPHEFRFVEREHRLPLFDAQSFAQIKRDRIFTVRTPEAFATSFVRSLVFFILAFWLMHIAMSIKAYMPGKPQFDEWLLPLVMFLSGVGFLMLFSLQDPLHDMFFGGSTARAVLLLGVATSVVLLFNGLSPAGLNRLLGRKEVLDLRRLLYWTPSLWLCERLGPSVSGIRSRLLRRQSRGHFWLFASMVVMLILALFGTGPEGSGVKVNVFGVQVSELSKIFVVFFMAYYLHSMQNKLRGITDNRVLFVSYLAWVAGLFALLIAVYVGIVGDQGPALVLCITLMLLYAYAIDNLGLVLATSVLFALGLYGAAQLELSWWYCAVVLLGALVYVFVKRKHESILFPIMLMSAFVALSVFSGDFSQRLADRNSMYQNIWDNSLYGGDQIAHGIWALGSGGLSGQDLGLGLSRVMPAYNTDMIFESIGEELGIFFLLFLLVLYIWLYLRCLRIARNTGNSLFAYIIVGIATVTLVQFCVIVAGSLGLIPLTGISVPFLSRGDSSLLVNLVAFFIILFLSQSVGSKQEVEQLGKRYDMPNVYLFACFAGIALVFGIKLGLVYYQSDETMVRPVKTQSRQGEWLLSENPRLTILKSKLPTGNIYDRNGVLLATSDKDAYLAAERSVQALGGNMEEYQRQKRRQQRRYYPFSESLIYWLGDAESGLVTSTRLGYVAEYRLRERLSGLPSAGVVRDTLVSSDTYQEAPYLPRERRESRLRQLDNSAYVPFLRAGVNSEMVKAYDVSKYHVHLSLDLALQQRIDKILAEDYPGLRSSVVVSLAKTGDVLASANHPLPKRDEIRRMNNFPPKYYQMLYTHAFGYDAVVADRDFGISRYTTPGSSIKTIDAMAYLNKAGRAAAERRFTFYDSERLRGDEPTGSVDLRTAIVQSSNLYFIALMNEEELHHQLFPLYHSVGMHVVPRGAYNIDKPSGVDEHLLYRDWYDAVATNIGKAYKNPKYQRTRDKYLHSDYSFIAWGQGPVEATPLQMARLYGAIANGGVLQRSRFVLRDYSGDVPAEAQERVMTHEGTAEMLAGYLREQSARVSQSLGGLPVYGKTGTPQRHVRRYNPRTKRSTQVLVRDGWYVCYVPGSKYDGSPLVLSVRLEGVKGSAVARDLATKLLKQLQAEGYFVAS